MKLESSVPILASIGLLASLVLSQSAVISAFSTIRVQVNNENVQSPPYLLEALKEIDKVANQSQSSLFVQANRTTTIIHQLSEDSRTSSWSPDTPLVPPAPVEVSSHPEISASPLTPLHDSLQSLGDQPAEIEPLETDHSAQQPLIESVASTGLQGEQTIVQQQQTSVKKVSSQLPVTSSHLKKPLSLSSNIDDSSNNQAANELSPAVPESASLVSPSVALEQEPKLKEENALGVTSESKAQAWRQQHQELVDQATANRSLAAKPITRLVGIQSRTRISVSGLESVDSHPPVEDRLVDYDQEEQAISGAATTTVDQLDAAGPEYQQQQPQQQQQQQQQHHNQQQQHQQGPDRVIKVPERIVMSVDPPKQVQQIIRVTVNRTRLGKPDPRCPPNETITFEHEKHCDKYYFCDEGYKSEHTCPNGLMYGTQNPVKDYCIHRWHAVCLEKIIPNPISSPGCRWQYGIFSVQGSPRCSPDYFECIAGRFEVRKCTIEGQVYDDRSKACQYAERVGCPEEILSDFQCPPNDQDNVYWPAPRYFLNDRTLVHCISDRPRVVRCADNERADPENLHCVPINRHDSPSIERKIREKQRG